jgi:hypothetical protein
MNVKRNVIDYRAVSESPDEIGNFDDGTVRHDENDEWRMTNDEIMPKLE